MEQYVEQLIKGQMASMSFEECYRCIYMITIKTPETDIRETYQKCLCQLKNANPSEDIIHAFNAIFMYPIRKYHLEIAC
jgi:hypothetical protein